MLVPETPLSVLTPLTATTPPKAPSPSILVLDTPVIRTLPQVQDVASTPKASAMDISPPLNTPKPIAQTPSSQPVIHQIVPDAQMTDAQKARVDEVLLNYKKQEEDVLQMLQATCQCTRDAEIALALEKAKLREAELLAERIRTDEITRQSPPLCPT